MCELIGKHKKEETAIICGSAPCLLSEFAIVKKYRPQATVLVVNDAAAAVFGDYLVSLHAEKFEEFKAKSLNQEIKTIAGKNTRKEAKWDYFMPNACSGATSTYSAVQIARQMGFGEIIICGAPMNAEGGYFFRPAIKDRFFRFWGFGDAPKGAPMIQRYQENLMKYASEEDCSMVRSCSGFTAEVFGKPDFLSEVENGNN